MVDFIWRLTKNAIVLFLIISVAFGCKKEEENVPELLLNSLKMGNESLTDGQLANAPLDQPIIASFNNSIDTSSFKTATSILDEENNEISYRLNFSNDNKNVTIYPLASLDTYKLYKVIISDQLTGENGNKFSAVEYQFRTLQGKLVLESLTAGDIDLMSVGKITDVPLDLQIIATFSDDLDPESITNQSVRLKWNAISLIINRTVDGNKLIIDPVDEILYWTSYELELTSSIAGPGAVDFDSFETEFFTELDSTLKFPELTDDELLTKIQEQTFKYFWDFGHPVSGLSRERNTSGDNVTIGGSGFGVMSILVGIERGFITRQQGVDRLETIINFLEQSAERFHGVWSHWLSGTTGKVNNFSSNDDGADLVETAFMIEGLITVRQYLDENDTQEAEMIATINRLIDEVEWDWFRQNDQNVLYWHWSPNYGWEKNHKIQGWNEALIVYVMAASSTTHSVPAVVYESGWARNGGMVNGNSYYDIPLPLGFSQGGPLFFSHYSFLGLDPRDLSDQYADYWEQNVNHSLINYSYCVDNPKKYIGYGPSFWGLTASDGNSGYSAHSPTNDKGVITPTAALSSFPYTPEESMEAARFFYYIVGDRLWGNYGFHDALNPTAEWTASSYLAIDQGPIILMIENYRTGLLWDLFMSAPEVQNGLTELGFTY